MPGRPSDYPIGAIGQEVTASADPSGVSLQDHSQPGVWVRVTGAPVSGRHPFVSVVRQASGDGWADLPAGPGAPFGTTAAGGAPLRTPDGSDLATGTVAFAVPDPAHPDGPGWLAVGGGVGGGAASEWQFGKVVSGTNSSGYVLRRTVMTGTNAWEEVDPVEEVTAYRAPSATATLPNIPVGQFVLYRPAGGGLYECSPWGGQLAATATVAVPVATGLTVTNTGCNEDGTPFWQGSITHTDYTLAITFAGRDLVLIGASLTPPPPPPPPP